MGKISNLKKIILAKMNDINNSDNADGLKELLYMYDTIREYEIQNPEYTVKTTNTSRELRDISDIEDIKTRYFQ